MARRKTPPDFLRVKSGLSERLKQIRTRMFGERGGPEMARRLGVPIRTWYNYESGVTVPAEVVLKFVELSGVDPIWLLRGEGEPFRSRTPSSPASAAGPPDPASTHAVRELLRAALERLESRAAGRAPNPRLGELAAHGVESPSSGRGLSGPSGLDSEGRSGGSTAMTSRPRVMVAQRDWLNQEEDTRCLLVEGDAMTPMVADGAFVAYMDRVEPLESLDHQLVVARVEGELIVRWLQLSGRYAILRAENPEAESATKLLELPSRLEEHPIRRVLWISTPH